MLHLIYGSDTYRIYKSLDSFKEKNYKNFIGDVNSLANLVTTTSLFGTSVNYIINLDINNISVNDSFIKLLEKSKNSNYNLLFVCTSTVTAKYLKLFDVKDKYDLADNKEIFSFLDNVFTKNTKPALALLSDYIRRGEEIYIMSMLFYVIKNIVFFYYNKEEFAKINSFVQKKTQNYINNGFTKEKLNNVVHALSEADYKIKSGADSKSILFSLVLYICFS